MTYTEKELDQFLHGISLSLLSKKSAQHWRYDEETAKEIEWLEALERKVRADKADRKTEPTISKMEQVDEPQTQLTAKCLECNNSKACKENNWQDCRYEPLGYEVTAVVGTIKDDPQTEDGIMPEVKAEVRFDENNKTLWIKTDTVENYDRVIIEDGSNWCRIFYEECGECAHNTPRSNDEPQTDCSWK